MRARVDENVNLLIHDRYIYHIITSQHWIRQ